MLDGYLSVLNIGAGDIKITFDKQDPADVARAKRVIGDMLKRGYLLFIESPDGLLPVKKFDAETEEYIVVDGATEEAAPETLPLPKRKGRGKSKRVPLREGKVTGIGPTAGG